MKKRCIYCGELFEVPKFNNVFFINNMKYCEGKNCSLLAHHIRIIGKEYKWDLKKIEEKFIVVEKNYKEKGTL